MDSGSLTVTLKADVDPSWLFLMGAESWATQVGELRDLAAKNGAPITYDLTMFGIDWSPQFGPDSDDPVSWTHKDGKVSEGPKCPLDVCAE